MTTASMCGSASKRSGKGVKRGGPAKLIGLARSENIGSTKMFLPPICHSMVAWPNQVAVVSLRLLWM